MVIIMDKMIEYRRKWFGHVMRKSESGVSVIMQVYLERIIGRREKLYMNLQNLLNENNSDYVIVGMCKDDLGNFVEW